jgi:hypothetical protein
MNPAITAAIIAAHEQAPTLVQRLTTAGALSGATAIAVASETAAQRAEVEQALRSGIVRRRADGYLFVDRQAVAERNARIGRAILLWGAIALTFLASAVALLSFAR